MRKPFVVANWKMNFLNAEVLTYMGTLISEVGQVENVEIGIAAQDIYLPELGQMTKTNNIQVVAQNAHWENSGSFTGETSPAALFDLGVDYVMLGHFERREFFNESNDTVNRKVVTALNDGLKVIVDVEEFEQVEPVLKGITEEQMSRITIAFEPTYAIGSGVSASGEGAQDVARRIRAMIGDLYNLDTAHAVRILYGGSVTVDNASEFINQRDIDGVLVGKAGLNVDNFIEMINIARAKVSNG
ncbi:MAG: triose-phosphate isomerase [Lactobacillaceae bacterium]|jgi:triosephosphate isomerase|nr:triose-phosphate isomerase [Lactobacillaceae bacterium]